MKVQDNGFIRWGCGPKTTQRGRSIPARNPDLDIRKIQCHSHPPGQHLGARGEEGNDLYLLPGAHARVRQPDHGAESDDVYSVTIILVFTCQGLRWSTGQSEDRKG